METDTARELFRGYLYRRYGDRSTPKHYLSELAIFLAHLGDKPITEVNAKAIRISQSPPGACPKRYKFRRLKRISS